MIPMEHAGACRLAEAELFQTVKASNGFFLSNRLETAPDDVRNLLLANGVIDEAKLQRPDLIEAHTSCCRLDEWLGGVTKGTLFLKVVWILVTDLVIETQ